MCGILGIYQSGKISEITGKRFREALHAISHRGPDDEGVMNDTHILLGHRRLSVIDLSTAAHQPMTDPSGRYTIVFNGEIFNFKELRSELQSAGITFRSQSDTETLLQLYIRQKENCLARLNGFFAFAIYDTVDNELFIARDRYGIKPLYYYFDGADTFGFGSEIRPLKKSGLPAEIDYESLLLYLQLNYIPAPNSIYKGYRKVKPGHYLKLRKESSGSLLLEEDCWYRLPEAAKIQPAPSYKEACITLEKMLDAAVERRLISDVPLGAFLSGGIDSSIITALAARHHPGIHTFSVGFSEDAHFDETAYSHMVAKHCGTKHTAFRLSRKDLYDAIPEMSGYFDEPFADSSALAVYILSKETRRHVTVALSGDGSDELFAGYQKHRAEWLLRNKKIYRQLLPAASGILGFYKGSRDSKIGNRVRQLHRFAQAAGSDFRSRYWQWCSITSQIEAYQLLSREVWPYPQENFSAVIRQLTPYCDNENDFNDQLRNDCRLILPGDMLTKVDLMSMASSLEVRVPFLDYTVVDYAFRLPASYKIDAGHQKKILKDSFGHLLPDEIFARKKQGFEVPLSAWMNGPFKSQIKSLLSPEAIRAQGIFEAPAVSHLLKSLDVNAGGDHAARLWGLIVFQLWWEQHKSE
ncbi:MAG: asparagine synthase (glutamine-hydrolyzing) [Bacteroidia bacterium]